MGAGRLDALQISGTSITQTMVDAATTANINIPNAAYGNPARFVLIVTDNLIAFQPVQSLGSPALSTMARLSPNDHLILNVTGFTQLRFERIGASPDPSVTLTPLENQ